MYNNYRATYHQQQQPRDPFTVPQPPVQVPQNRFVYVKQNFFTPEPHPATKVLVNPNFLKNIQVHINPKFKPKAPPVSNSVPTSPNSIHINPNIRPIIGSKLNIHINPKIHPNLKIHINPKVLKPPPAAQEAVKEPEPPKTRTIVSTKTKFVRVPVNVTEKTPERKRRHSLHTKYKIVRSSPISNSSYSISQFKIDKRSPNKRKFVYVNRFVSISDVVKNAILKTRRSSVNTSGVLYKKSPNSLKKQQPQQLAPKASSSRYKFVRVPASCKTSPIPVEMKKTLIIKRFKLIRSVPTKLSPKQDEKRKSVVKRFKLIRSTRIKTGLNTEEARKSLVKRFKVIRSKKVLKVAPNTNRKTLRKCNMPCPIYRQFGKCKGKERGTCIRQHNPDQIVLCTRFLQGACLNDNCLLSHKVSHEKMPTCKYYLEGLCTRDSCPYLHVKISAKADICRDFLEGFCKSGSECDKRHQFLCPDFEKTKECPRRRCRYPHGDSTVRKRKISLGGPASAKKYSVVRKERRPPRTPAQPAESRAVEKAANNRYYDDDNNLEPKLPESAEGDSAEKAEGVCPTGTSVGLNRPKLGILPAFIPLFEDT